MNDASLIFDTQESNCNSYVGDRAAYLDGCTKGALKRRGHRHAEGHEVPPLQSSKLVSEETGFDISRHVDSLQQKLLRRIRNPDRTFAEESRDAIVDVAADLHVTARLVRPDE